MSNPAALAQEFWNYCNMGPLAPARLGLHPSAPQNPFRSPPSGSSLRDDGSFFRISRGYCGQDGD